MADAQIWGRAEGQWVRLGDMSSGALPCEAIFAAPSEPELLGVPAAKRVGSLGLTLELV